MTQKALEPIIIKKYANRRLYNTETSSYVTLEDIAQMVREDKEFVVRDAKSSEDLTRQILTQIICEQEAGGESMLPVSFLRSIIGAYGQEVQKVLPPYLEATMQHFAKNQQEFTKVLDQSMAGYSPFTQLEEISRQNMEFFRQTMAAFNPFEKAKKD
jgi:polyhydroxyalkanoate synthesis repressor PhaR